ncbi:MAG TPA: carbamoyltransferase HypF [Myxococcales bacterium]|nr:carbamoyltransferase HypF [Myxococcales bacterium]
MAEGRQIEIRGIVQGVGFRPWVYRVARDLGVAGRVLNDASGVRIEAFASAATLDRFVERLQADAPPAARIQSLSVRAIAPQAPAEFVIAPSAGSSERRVSIPSDLATCPDCLSEIFDPRDRRYRYPFTNCTNCGPRFTIARDVPYDRPATTMAPFRMCPECAREYADPGDRRFHAQPNACPACGPRLRAVPDAPDPLAAARKALRRGEIVAVKGIGGFHLACDAASPAAVQRLRERKRREERPFAVMARDLSQARGLSDLAPEEEALLLSPERPIVLVRRRPDAALADCVAPGSPLLGLMLAYSPLHHLLLADFGGPLVMTSANLSEEPICYRDGEAAERLGGIFDLLLLHDREIETRCDDSIVRLIASAPSVLRRSRGYVPRAIALRRPVPRPILAVGADLKNTFCVAAGDQAFLGPHIGDLGSAETWRSLRTSVERMLSFLEVEPQVVVHDLHPDSVAAAYARTRSEPRLAVQHHHAHVASAMAEHGLEGPVIGVAYDGTGYGTDGSMWGGEVLLATARDYRRVATLRPIRLAGGDRAIRDVWRIALAALDDAFAGAPPLQALPLFRKVNPGEVAAVRQMIARDVNAPLARGVGRWFDAASAIGLGRTRTTFEGQAALEWDTASNTAPSGARGGRYPYEVLESHDLIELDLRPLIRELTNDTIRGRPAREMSASFHDSLSAATADLVRETVRRHGKHPVVLTGGCFQNARLAETIFSLLTPELEVFLHRDVPCGDGGIALGQALIAAVQ